MVKETELIPFLIESENGHENVDVPKEEVPEKVKEQLRNGRWVSVEGEDGKTELLTKKDLPEEENPEENMKWADRFENVESITSTKTVKGG